MKQPDIPQIDLIILAGSVLRPNFNWPKFLLKLPCRRVINDCGVNDNVLLLSQFGVLLTGMAGRVGFYGFTGNDIVNRFFVGGHGHYFASSRHDQNCFMRTYWLPSIVSGALPHLVDQRPPFGIFGGMTNAAVRFSDPLKLLFYGALVWFAYDSFYRQPRLELIAEQMSRTIAVAATAMENPDQAPTSFQSAMQVLQAGSRARKQDLEVAEDIARYSGQRLGTFGEAMKEIDVDGLFRWTATSYLATKPPLRLPGSPAWSVRVAGGSRVVLIDPDATISVMDIAAKRVVSRRKIAKEGEGTIMGDIAALSLSASTGTVGLEFVVERINDDDNSHYAISIDTTTGVLTVNDGGDTPISLASSADCTSFQRATRPPDDDDDLSAEQLKVRQDRIREESENSTRCITRAVVIGAQTLTFPKRLPESQNWTLTRLPALQAPAPENQSAPCADLSASVDFPHRVAHDAASLDFSKASATDLDKEIIQNRFFDPESGAENGCYVEFTGSSGKSYALTYGLAGTWWVTYLICEKLETRVIGRCATPEFAWNGSGRSDLSPDGKFITVASFGSDSAAAWNITDLSTMSSVSPAPSEFGYISAIAFSPDSSRVFVAGPAPGMQGIVKIGAYEVGRAVTMRASRLIEPSGQPRPADPNGADPLAEVKIFGCGEICVLATPYGDVIGFEMSASDPIWQPLADLSHELGISEEATQGIVLDWLSNPLGFSATPIMKFSYEPDGKRLLAYDGDRVRLIETKTGHMLMPAGEPFVNQGCGSLQSAMLVGAGAVVATTNSCRAERSAPPELEGLKLVGDNTRSPTAVDSELGGLPGATDVDVQNEPIEESHSDSVAK
ncbi:hypothetical protein GFM14_14630 [Rhizobium leguminosarum bv. viciae]|uniref:hypothetical protein n=1 Tax=Rhizobium leguminosarum TaxID=384 RepID=UPI0014420715|nr:hypothetical protein [Rhizobium leguminosarum]NKJ92819.1 hypothetical protein [Rhizobium leguminosarum bv. viciae]NKK86674.1 hypothetical protein [Rhizobium leguminosarum bv. viciae]